MSVEAGVNQQNSVCSWEFSQLITGCVSAVNFLYEPFDPFF